MKSPCLFACIDPIFNCCRLNSCLEELDQSGLEAKHNCIQSGQPAVSKMSMLLHNKTRQEPDVSVDEEQAPEADVASLCPVQLLQGQIREKSRPWKMSSIASKWIVSSNLWSPMRKKESTLTHSLTTTANAPLLMNPLIGSNKAVYGYREIRCWIKMHIHFKIVFLVGS